MGKWGASSAVDHALGVLNNSSGSNSASSGSTGGHSGGLFGGLFGGHSNNSDNSSSSNSSNTTSTYVNPDYYSKETFAIPSAHDIVRALDSLDVANKESYYQMLISYAIAWEECMNALSRNDEEALSAYRQELDKYKAQCEQLFADLYQRNYKANAKISENVLQDLIARLKQGDPSFTEKLNARKTGRKAHDMDDKDKVWATVSDSRMKNIINIVSKPFGSYGGK